jgi:hypothetical protein
MRPLQIKTNNAVLERHQLSSQVDKLAAYEAERALGRREQDELCLRSRNRSSSKRGTPSSEAFPTHVAVIAAGARLLHGFQSATALHHRQPRRHSLSCVASAILPFAGQRNDARTDLDEDVEHPPDFTEDRKYLVKTLTSGDLKFLLGILQVHEDEPGHVLPRAHHARQDGLHHTERFCDVASDP